MIFGARITNKGLACIKKKKPQKGVLQKQSKYKIGQVLQTFYRKTAQMAGKDMKIYSREM